MSTTRGGVYKNSNNIALPKTHTIDYKRFMKAQNSKFSIPNHENKAQKRVFLNVKEQHFFQPFRQKFNTDTISK